MPRARPETTVNPARASERGQPLGDPDAVGRAPARADQRDRELVARLERPLHVEQRRRVGDLLERRRIARLAAGDRHDTRPPAEVELGLGRQVVCRAGADLLGELAARRPAHREGRQAEASSTPPGGPEPLQQGPARVRPHAGTIVRQTRSRSSVVGGRSSQALLLMRIVVDLVKLGQPNSESAALRGRRRASARRSARRGRGRAAGRSGSCRAGSSCRGSWPRSGGRGRGPANGGRQAEPLEQAARRPVDSRPDPAQPLGQPALGDHAGRHGLAVLMRAARSRRPPRSRGRSCGRS